ncbi:MAG TPA: DUF1559 domain-containing protein [Pirellulales bacterium]|nr:DUF1559 domain-containing protein [Pirellulales bacterium]
MLASLILSAVQQARERARATECLNRLRHFGTASMSYNSARGTFPPTEVGYHAQLRLMRSISPHVYLLPYFEQGNLAVDVNLGERGNGDIPGSAPSSAVNANVLRHTVPLFLCPSDDPLPGGNSYRANFGIGPGLSHYSSTPGNGTGAFVNWTPMRAAAFRDGLSSTVLFSERLLGSGRPNAAEPIRDSFIYSASAIETVADCEVDCPLAALGPADTYLGASWLFGGYRNTWYNHVFTPNFRVVDCEVGHLGGGNGAFTARSFHVGGVNAVFADGSARLVHESIAVAVWHALGTRAGNEPIGEF